MNLQLVLFVESPFVPLSVLPFFLFGQSGLPLKCVSEPQSKQVRSLEFLRGSLSLSVVEPKLLSGMVSLSAGHCLVVTRSEYASRILTHTPNGPYSL